jgi:hypothetical protein
MMTEQTCTVIEIDGRLSSKALQNAQGPQFNGGVALHLKLRLRSGSVLNGYSAVRGVL